MSAEEILAERKRKRVASMLLVAFVAASADLCAQVPGEPVFAAVRASVRQESTAEASLPARFRTLGGLAVLVAPTAGAEALEKALPREAFDRIVELLRAGRAAEAFGSIDHALLALCDLGDQSPVRCARKVFFPGTDGARVAALLFEPEQPSTCGLVFGHGGYGSKEVWADVALALSQAGVWVLDLDFEGTGESGGISAWSARIRDFSYGIDFLQSELGLTAFGVAGHSGGGAWPAACAAIDDARVSTVVLWDCPFDFYDIHLTAESEDPGGNPAAVLEDIFARTRSLPAALRPPEADETRGLPARLDAMYEEVEATLSKYRHPAQLLAEQQRERRLAVLHIVAEELIRQLGPSPRGGQYELAGESRSEVRGRYLGRLLRFQESELFARPEGLWEQWDRELGEPKRSALIRGTNHAFAPPGRMEAVRESVEWLRRHLLAAASPPLAPEAEPFIVLSEFQVWADARGPEVFQELSRLYNEKGRSHVFDLYPRYELFVWDAARMRRWVDEAKALGCFNLFCLGDDTRTAQGHLFDDQGVNPKLQAFLFDTVAYAHQQGLLVAVEPTHLPPLRTRAAFVPWLESWLGPQVPAESRVDVIKLSIEWFGAWPANPEIATEVEAFFEAAQDVSPGTLVYVDSIGGFWRQPQPFHRWLLKRFPGTILSHYLNTDQIPAFRAIGARNLMVQVNPSETFEAAGQFFIYHDFTVRLLKDVVAQRVRFVSLAGVNFGYSRYNYDLFLDVVRPHLKLARSLDELRAALDLEVPPEGPTPEEVAAALVALARQRAEERIRQEPTAPLNAASRPAWFGETPDGWILGLDKLADGRSGARFEGAYTEPVRRRPVRATFGIDLGQEIEVRRVRVIPCLAESGPEYVAREFRLEYLDQGTWKTIPGAAWRDHRERRILLSLPEPVTTAAIRLVILDQSDDGQGNYRACCQELEVNP